MITFDPRLPATWTGLTFQITLRGTRVRVNLTREEICFEVVAGDTVEMSVRGQRVVVPAPARQLGLLLMIMGRASIDS